MNWKVHVVEDGSSFVSGTATEPWSDWEKPLKLSVVKPCVYRQRYC